MNTNLGPAIPLSRAAPRVTNRLDEYPWLKAHPSRVDRRGESPPVDVGGQYASILANTAPKGAVERRQISPVEAAAVEARQARTAGTAPANESRDMSQVLTMLEAILARLDALEARVTIIDGNATGEAA
jgi:hypothetical protein